VRFRDRRATAPRHGDERAAAFPRRTYQAGARPQPARLAPGERPRRGARHRGRPRL